MTALYSTPVSPTQRRSALRAGLASGTIQRLPGAFSPLVARAIEDAGFEASTSPGLSSPQTWRCRTSA